MSRQWQHSGNGFSLMIPLLSRGGIILKWRTMGFDCSRGWRKSNKTEPKSPRTDGGEEIGGGVNSELLGLHGSTQALVFPAGFYWHASPLLLPAAVQSLNSLNDQIAQFMVTRPCSLADEDEAFIPAERDSLRKSMTLMRHLLMDAQVLTPLGRGHLPCCIRGFFKKNSRCRALTRHNFVVYLHKITESSRFTK